jgi:hypothetical protein
VISLNVVQDVLVPFVIGIVIPFLTAWTSKRGWPIWIETFLNFALSALGGALTSVAFNGDWKTYLLSAVVVWLGALRSHYTAVPQMLYSDRVNGKHEKQDQV